MLVGRLEALQNLLNALELPFLLAWRTIATKALKIAFNSEIVVAFFIGFLKCKTSFINPHKDLIFHLFPFLK
jgi:hypothetical protein